MSIENISNEEFFKILLQIFKEDLDPEINENYLLTTISDELKKAKYLRDYSLVHECYLTLSECFGYSYNNEYEELSNKQIKRRKNIYGIKQLFAKSKTAIL